MAAEFPTGNGAKIPHGEWLARIRQAALWMRRSADLAGVVKLSLTSLRQAGLVFEAAAFHLVDENLQRIERYTLYPPPVDWRTEPLVADRPEVRACLTGQTQQWSQEEGRCWHLAAPGAVGVLCLMGRGAPGCSGAAQALVEELATAIEIAVVRHQDLFALEMARARVTRIDADLLALYDGSSDLSGETQDEVAQRIIRRVTTALEFDRAGVFLVDRGQALLRGAWGMDAKGSIVSIPRTTFPLYPEDPQQLTQTALVARGDRAYFLTQDLDGEGMGGDEGKIRASLAVPMRMGNRIVGVLAVDNGLTNRPIYERQVQPLMILANLGATALENARLHQLRGVVEGLGEGLLIADLEGRVLHANAHLVELTGLAREAWVGKSLDECPLRLHQLSGEVEVQRPEGGTVWVEVRTGPYHSMEGEPVGTLVRVRDIDRRKRAEAELEAQRSLVMRADRLRSLGEMAAGIAHELNQPLVGVRGLAEHLLISLERGWPLDTAKLRLRLEGIVEQADRMVHIVEHVRKFARQAGQPERSLVQVNQVVQSALDLLPLQSRASELEVELEVELGEGLPLVRANPYSLEEVVIHLLSNARDAVEEAEREGAEEAGRVVVRTGLVEGWVRIAVEDSGGGMPAAVLERVFEPFFTTKDPDRGTGLGLSISKSIVEQFEGRLELSSVVGQGTTAAVFLPPTAGEVNGSGAE